MAGVFCLGNGGRFEKNSLKIQVLPLTSGVPQVARHRH